MFVIVASVLLVACVGQTVDIYAAARPDSAVRSGVSGNASKSVPVSPAQALPTLLMAGHATNVTQVVIGGGPAGSLGKLNVPFVSVTLCRPGTSICQTIEHVLVDTGSYGLRVLASAALFADLALPVVTGATGQPVGECAQLFNGFLWGSVRLADVKIAGETAPSLPIQHVSDEQAAFKNIPVECSNRGANAGTVAKLGANGILGIGLFREDCGDECTKRVIAGIYYECGTIPCAGTVMPLIKQVSNPVPAFATNNNGVVLVMPAVETGGVTTLVGTLTFGVDTQANNKVGSATVYPANERGNFTTVYKGKTLKASFLDSGANGLFFFDPAIHPCTSAASFFCPATPITLSAVNTAANGVTSGRVSFTIEGTQLLHPSIRAASVGGTIGRNLNNKDFDWVITENAQSPDVLVRAANVGGSPQHLSRSTAFVWGMPFFFGRTVFLAIDGAKTRQGTGPYWAY